MSIKIELKADLASISLKLKELSEQAKAASDSIEKSGKQGAETIDNITNKSKRNVFDLRAVTKDFQNDIMNGFKAMTAVSAISTSFKLPKLIGDTLKAASELNDTFKKLGDVFGFSKDKFGDLQNKMVRGLGDIGQSAQVVTKTLQALATTPVREAEQIEEYAKNSAMLASISGTPQDQGNIAGSIASTLQAQGKNPNDISAVKELSESVRKIYNATGRTPEDILNEMQDIFKMMPADLRKKVDSNTLGTVFAARTAGGEGTTKFLEEYLGKSKLERLVFESFGGGNLIKNGKLDTTEFKNFQKNVTGLIGMDPRKSAEALGISPEAAEGMMRLAESLDTVDDLQQKITNSTGNLNQQYRDSMTLTEALSANINKLSSSLSGAVGATDNLLTNLLKKTSETTTGSAAVVGVGALVALLLGGKGLAGLASSLPATAAKSIAAEKAFGTKTVPVYVTNFGEVSGGLGGGIIEAATDVAETGGVIATGVAAATGAIIPLVAGAAGAAVGGAIGYFGQPLVSGALDYVSMGKNEYGYEGNSLDRLIFKIDELLGSPTGISSSHFKNQELQLKLKVEMEKTEGLKTYVENRGTTY